MISDQHGKPAGKSEASAKPRLASRVTAPRRKSRALETAAVGTEAVDTEAVDTEAVEMVAMRVVR